VRGPAKALADRLRAHEALRFLFVKMPAPAEVELAGAAGFDAVILDTEHGAGGGVELEHHLRAAAAAGVPALVRVPSIAAAPILQALDAGAAGVVVAHITDAAAASAVVEAAHYPPRGRRGLALTTRAGGYGTADLADHLARAARETIVVVQIEDAAAVARSGEILAVEGVDGVLIGSTDLSISTGHPGDPGHPEVAAAIGEIRDAAGRAGAAVAVVTSTPAEADVAHAGGVTACVFVSTLLVRDAFRAAAGVRVAGARAVGARVVTAPAAGAGPGGPWAGPIRGGIEPLVLLPGMLGTAALWDGVAPALAGAALVSFGRIDLDDSIEEMAASVLAAAPDRFALAGHSLGAIVALSVVRQAPDRVTRLALLNASARAASDAQLASWASLEERVHSGDFAGSCADFARQNVTSDAAAGHEQRAQIEAMALAVGPRALLRQLTAQRTRPDCRPSLSAISCPTLVISGARDEVCPLPLQQELARGIAGVHLETLDGCGHMSPLEAPDQLAAVIAGWLR
jgi:4-hydroxy-2-oxoheptanedioate aldolase